MVTHVSPPDLVYVDDVFNTEHDNDNNNALVSTLSLPGLGQGDDISNTSYEDNDNAVVPDVCLHDDRQPWKMKSSMILQISCTNERYTEKQTQPIYLADLWI